MTSAGIADRRRPWFRATEVVMLPLLRVFTRPRWRGQEHIPRRGGVIVVANHVSKLDPMTFGHFVRDAGRVPRFLAKAELFSHRWVGRVFVGTDMIPVHRGAENAGISVAAAGRAVREGGCVVIYPEATITREPKLWPMVGKTGAARVALDTRAPVIPVAQWGAQRILPPYARRPRLWPPAPVHARAGAPVYLDDLYGREQSPALLAEATERIMAAITAELEVIRAEQAPAGRFDPRKAGVAEYGDPSRSTPKNG